MIKLNRTEKGIYYIYDYIPSRRWEYTQEDISNSERLARYKKKDKTYARDFYTKKLKLAIIELSNNYLEDKFDEIALFAVPPSKVDKYSAVRYSIGEIVNDACVKSKLNKIKRIHNCSEVLMRYKDVKTSHSNDNRRAYKHEHLLSIESTKDFSECGDNIAYIILDDITTTGTQMETCMEILIDYYADEDNIYMMAIGATKR